MQNRPLNKSSVLFVFNAMTALFSNSAFWILLATGKANLRTLLVPLISMVVTVGLSITQGIISHSKMPEGSKQKYFFALSAILSALQAIPMYMFWSGGALPLPLILGSIGGFFTLAGSNYLAYKTGLVAQPSLVNAGTGAFQRQFPGLTFPTPATAPTPPVTTTPAPPVTATPAPANPATRTIPAFDLGGSTRQRIQVGEHTNYAGAFVSSSNGALARCSLWGNSHLPREPMTEVLTRSLTMDEKVDLLGDKVDKMTALLEQILAYQTQVSRQSREEETSSNTNPHTCVAMPN